jgi:hypothetical protein
MAITIDERPDGTYAAILTGDAGEPVVLAIGDEAAVERAAREYVDTVRPRQPGVPKRGWRVGRNRRELNRVAAPMP